MKSYITEISLSELFKNEIRGKERVKKNNTDFKFFMSLEKVFQYLRSQ
jgi:hypothetical protein